jgi:hypothetical protein
MSKKKEYIIGNIGTLRNPDMLKAVKDNLFETGFVKLHGNKKK